MGNYPKLSDAGRGPKEICRASMRGVDIAGFSLVIHIRLRLILIVHHISEHCNERVLLILQRRLPVPGDWQRSFFSDEEGAG